MQWRRRKLDDFGAEIEAHLQLEADELRTEGHADAEHAARRAFGNRAIAEERFYEAGRWMWFEQFVRDVRFAARVLLKDLRFSALAAVGLALGIGTSTAIFALINASLAENDEPASYVGISRVIDGRPRGVFSTEEFRRFRDQSTTLQSFDTSSGRVRLILGPLRPGGDADETDARLVSGQQIILGRGFAPEEERPGGSPVALVGSACWKARFAGDPTVLGRTVVLNAHTVTIVGVAKDRANLAEFYLPLGMRAVMRPGADPDEAWLMLGAQLRPGVSRPQAQAEMDVLVRGLPKLERGHEGVLVSAGGSNPEKRREMIAVVTAVTLAVSMILLIACSNLANLLLARAAARRREIGVRLSLGASRRRVVGQLLTESLLLALSGGALGILFSNWLARSLLLLANPGPGLVLDLHPDPRVVLYGIALSLTAGLSFGLAPALAATRTNLSEALHGQVVKTKDPARPAGLGRNLLLVIPLAVSLMLLLGAGIAVRRALGKYDARPTFDAGRVVGMSLRLHMQGYDEARARQFQERLRVRITAMPQAVSVALATAMPLSNTVGWFRTDIEGRPSVGSDYNAISPTFFQTLGAAVVRGRGFRAEDREGGAPVALVNEEFARRYWPGEESIGKRIRLTTGAAFFAVVGVVPDLEDAAADFNSVRPTVYVPQSQAGLFLSGARPETPPFEMQLLVRAAGDPAVVKTALRQEARAADPQLRVTIQTVEEIIDSGLRPLQTVSMMLSALGGLALLMASVGIYAILAYAVSQRTREIGIRLALGARRGEIVGMIMRRTSALIAWGIAIGLGGALLLSRAMARSIAKLGHLDAVTCTTVSLLLAAVALTASYLPARKALGVDPAESLRSE